jgi:hypothetical protein
MTRRKLTLLLALLLIGVPDQMKADLPSPASSKIRFQLDAIRADGLRGPADGLVSVAYEFCIPKTTQAYEEVQRIDPTIQIAPGGKGRIGCSASQALCLGNTHQKNWKEVLLKLAALSYVSEIRECFFE